jgi:glutamate N-acetyltransferase/amino-acid N-acetyltransferase
MQKSEIVITVNLGTSDSSESVWTTDLSYDYVKINAEYRS